MYKRELIKPDGRHLTLYASAGPVAEDIVATSPAHGPVEGSPHLRWHPLREEWVAYASHRQNRTFLPPKEFNPLAPTRTPDFPTELPSGAYDVAVFDNLFASLRLSAREAPESIVPVRPGDGHCEVVVFTQDPDTSLARLPVERLDLLLQVWADRYREIAARSPQIQYILPFENRGVEVGVTLHHPHGQIYAYPFVPPLEQQMLRAQKAHFQRTKRGLVADLCEEELRDGRRIVHHGASTAAFIPAFARYPYETWIVPERQVAGPGEFTPEERLDFARTLKAVLLKMDGLWGKPFPYLMALYAAPTDGEPHPEWGFHIEFYPPYRSRDRLKYLAGTELAAGMFVNDSLPEEKAKELREVKADGV